MNSVVAAHAVRFAVIVPVPLGLSVAVLPTTIAVAAVFVPLVIVSKPGLPPPPELHAAASATRFPLASHSAHMPLVFDTTVANSAVLPESV
jgi:hypothetical protein